MNFFQRDAIGVTFHSLAWFFNLLYDFKDRDNGIFVLRLCCLDDAVSIFSTVLIVCPYRAP